jgi:hypothetical protein
MASQTKVEPGERSTPAAPTSGIAERAAGDPPASSVAALAAGSDSNDDEDVSLDELMMSDSSDGEDETPAAEAPRPAATALPADGVAAPEPSPAAPASDAPFETYGQDPLDDEAASLAAAAAAQEAAAQAAAAEADARVDAARRQATEKAETAPLAPPVNPPAEASADDAIDAPTPPPPANAAPLPVPYTSPVLPAPPPPAPFSPELMQALTGSGEELDSDDDSDPPLSVDLESPVLGDEDAAPRAGDAPLPSFDIPEVESSRQGRRLGLPEENTPSHVHARNLATPLHLSEVAEDDDDDAVTHIGLPVVPEAAGSGYTDIGATGFQVADPGVAALQGFDPDLSLTDARRATTRVVPRIDVARLEQQRRATSDTNPSLGRRKGSMGRWLSGVFQRYRPDGPQNDVAPQLARRASWLLDTVLPPLSLVLFGSGIGAGIMLLQPDRGAKAAQSTVQALREAPGGKRGTTLAERAEAGDGDALFKITNMSPNERTSTLTLALERGQQAQRQNDFKEFTRALEAPSGLAAPNLTARFLSFVTQPETMLPAFSHLLTWPGSTGPDVLYAVWEKAPGTNRAATLAQQLLHSEDQRKKATPALLTALDLRSASSCEDYLRVLPAVQRDGDQRCSATLRALKHRDGCGDDGQADCFACLREGTLLDDALTAIEGRVPPQL